ncbi:MAG: VOC family protein [Saprospiraceae bacterium]|nr:VOC family protein [Saprospiraceae bacterium]
MNLNQITVPSLDVEKAIQFYQQLGLNLIVKTLPKYARFECPEGDATFSIHQVDYLSNGPGVVIYFECENLDQQVSELLEKGVVFEQLPKDQSWLWKEARLRDPDNHQIVLFNAGSNRKNPPWRLDVLN